jgi:sirohydrochlorin ferrochelatase
MKTSRLILFAHGSRDPRWRKPFEKLPSSVAAELGSKCVRLAYLEMFRPTLFDTQVAEAQAMFPQMHVDVVRPVGEHPSVVSAVKPIARQALR